MPSKSIPEPWQSFFSDIDASLHEDVELHCLGGFVVTVLYDLARPTADVDLIIICSLLKFLFARFFSRFHVPFRPLPHSHVNGRSS